MKSGDLRRRGDKSRDRDIDTLLTKVRAARLLGKSSFTDPRQHEDFFESEQLAALEARLADVVVDGVALDDALFLIGTALWSAKSAIGVEARRSAAERQHSQDMARVRDSIRGLRRVLTRLGDNRPVAGLLAGIEFKEPTDCVRAGEGLYAELDGMLARVERAASTEAASAPGRGRPPLEWRDKLIAVIHSVYPPEVAKVEAGSHFEQTVELVLSMLDHHVDNLHAVVESSLRRRPEPHVQIRREEKPVEN